MILVGILLFHLIMSRNPTSLACWQHTPVHGQPRTIHMFFQLPVFYREELVLSSLHTWSPYCAKFILVHGYWCSDTDSKVHGANMGPICAQQDPDGPHVGPMNFAIWNAYCKTGNPSAIAMKLLQSCIKPLNYDFNLMSSTSLTFFACTD